MVTASPDNKLGSKHAREGGKFLSLSIEEDTKKKRTAARKAPKLSVGNGASCAPASTSSSKKAALDGMDVVKASLRKFQDKMRGVAPRTAVAPPNPSF